MMQPSYTAHCDICGTRQTFVEPTEARALQAAEEAGWLPTGPEPDIEPDYEYMYCPACDPHANIPDETHDPGAALTRLTVVETLEHHITVPTEEVGRALTSLPPDAEGLSDDSVQELLADLYINIIGDTTVSAVPDRAVTAITNL